MRRDHRRAVRTTVWAITVLLSITYIGWIISLGDTDTIRQIAYGLLGIVGFSTIGYIAENVTQRIALKWPGGGASIGGKGNPDDV